MRAFLLAAIRDSAESNTFTVAIFRSLGSVMKLTSQN